MTIFVSPFRRALRLIDERKPSHVLSLLSPDTDALSGPLLARVRHLTLRFNDIASPADGLDAPNEEAVSRILQFADDWAGTAPLLVHCWAGVSRSTAAAYILACRHYGSGSEVDLAIKMRTTSPSATPNRLMITLADRLLGRSGHMIKAIEAIGPGVVVGEAEPFELKL